MGKRKVQPSAWIATVEDGVVASSRPAAPLPAAPVEPEREWDVDNGVVRAGWGWHPRRAPHPAHLNAWPGWKRGAEQRREAEALAERVEARYVGGMRLAMAEAELVEAAQDAAVERRLLIESGLLHLLDAAPVATRSASAADVPVPPGVAARPASGLARRISNFFTSTEHGGDCPCSACVRHRVARKGGRSTRRIASTPCST